MPNYGEEWAYWYLRLNGFFPISNFVAHRSKLLAYSADVDILGIRLPYVYEEIGGKPEDWDFDFLPLFDMTLPLGVICEVKTGRLDVARIFRDDVIEYSMGRFGFTPNHSQAVSAVSGQALTIVPQSFQIAKILFSNDAKEIESNEKFFHISLAHTRKFIRSRIIKYPKEKYADRMFFDSVLVQDLIDTTIHDSETGVCQNAR
ncbi:MAG: hypothetical protein HY868_14790 [Chloroflexi bacterium]|nr:hypothetical protein [Chloroflexota bacterium]